MILVWAVLIGFLAALLRFRKQVFLRLGNIQLHSTWLVLLAIGLQIPLLRQPAGPPAELLFEKTSFFISFLLLLAFVCLNRGLLGAWEAGMGIFMNLVVILANGGLMPITPQTLVIINPGSQVEEWQSGDHYPFSKDVILASQDTRLQILSDTLALPWPLPRRAAFSLGDIFLAVGIVIFFMDIPVMVKKP